MSNIIYHLAQFNIIKLKDQLNAPIIKEFKDFLAPVNQLAEESPGFIWRLKDESGASATDITTPYEDELIFINMSIWIDYESLKTYSYQTVHSYFLKGRKKWANKMEGHQAVLWWIPKGQIPTTLQAKAKLDQLNDLGSTADAFGMNELYSSDGIKL